MIKEILLQMRAKYLPKGSFRNDFATLTMGRVVAQIVPLLITPILTRIYTPEDFGVFAVFIAIVTIISLISTGRYNLAITLPKEPQKATELFLVCLIGVVSVTIFSFLIFFTFQGTLLDLLSLQDEIHLILFIPLGVFVVASIESIYYWLLRSRDYFFLSKNFIIQTTAINVLKFAFAFLYWGWQGLVLAYILGALLSLILLTGRFLRKSNFFDFLKEVSIKDLTEVVKQYRKFPLFSMPADGINSVAKELPNMLLNSLFGTDIAGLYSITQRILRLPIAFISSAMTDVYRERASSDYREKGDCRKIFLVTLKYLVLFSIIPFILIYLFAPALTPIILGEQWVEVGGYIRILTPLFFFKFVASPLSSTMYINQKQKVFLLWQIGLLICTVGSFYFGNIMGDENTALLLFSISYAIMYAISILLAYKFTRK